MVFESLKKPLTGGPAFPFNEKDPYGVHYCSHSGMTLRDHFAAKAMTMIPYPQHLGLQEYETKHFADYTQRMAAAAYQIADAMIKAREEKP